MSHAEIRMHQKVLKKEVLRLLLQYGRPQFWQSELVVSY